MGRFVSVCVCGGGSVSGSASDWLGGNRVAGAVWMAVSFSPVRLQGLGLSVYGAESVGMRGRMCVFLVMCACVGRWRWQCGC